MTPTDILTRATAAGLILYPGMDGLLHVRGPAHIRARWLETIRQYRDALILHLWTERLRDHFEERAAILEHEAGLSRAEAEREARRATFLLARNGRAPWAALRQALADPALPDSTDPVNRIDGVPGWTVHHLNPHQPIRQGVIRHERG